MILVTVGTHDQQFDRLVKGADQIAAALDERVIIQRGCSNYLPSFAEHFQWTSSQRMEALIAESRLVISQASAGAIIHAIRMEKPLILVPRLRRYRENHNDHQLQLAQALEEIGRAVIVAEPKVRMLQSAIERCVENNFRIPGDNHLQKSLKQLLENWSGSSLALNPEVEH
ncbi:MAG: glycosyltransferase [Anaerolineales bacterium]